MEITFCFVLSYVSNWKEQVGRRNDLELHEINIKH
jgi:hypothetical protein